MKSLAKFIDEKVINENNSLSDYCVKFVKVNGDPGIMFEGEYGEYQPDELKAICKAIGLEYNDGPYENDDVPVYFWNIKKNSCYYVSRRKCKNLI